MTWTALGRTATVMVVGELVSMARVTEHRMLHFMDLSDPDQDRLDHHP